MDYFNRLLASMPAPADVWADAERRYGADTLAASHYAAHTFEGRYLQAKLALASLLDEPEEEESLDADDPRTVDTGDPGATVEDFATLEVPPLDIVDGADVPAEVNP